MPNQFNTPLNKHIVPLFDPIDWELQTKNLEDVAKTQDINLNDIRYADFVNSIYQLNDEKFESELKKHKDDYSEATKQEKIAQYQKTRTETMQAKVAEVKELFSNGLKKLIQKQDANKYITDVIDRDENIKLACMNSLYRIYKSFLDSELLETLVGFVELDNIDKLERKNTTTQKFEKVFTQSHEVLSDIDVINFLKKLDPKFNQVSFIKTYKFFIEKYKVLKSTQGVSDEINIYMNKIYFSLLQDFFIFYIKGSGALYLLFTNNEIHKEFVSSASEYGDIVNLKDSKCLMNSLNASSKIERTRLIDAFNSLKLGNSDWDLNLCINPGIYEKLFDKFKLVYNYLLNWNRRMMCVCREDLFLKNEKIMNYVKEFYKQVNYDNIYELNKELEKQNDAIIINDVITINQTEVGVAFKERRELDSTIYRIVSENDLENAKKFNSEVRKFDVGKSYTIPWLGKEEVKEENLSLENIIETKKNYSDVINYIKNVMFNEESISIKYAFDNTILNKDLLNEDRFFYIQYNDSIDAFGLLRMSLLGQNVLNNDVNNATAGAGELLDISFIKEYTEMLSDWEHRDLLINSDRLPLVDFWDIIIDIQVTLRDNILQGKGKKIEKRLARLKFLYALLCCKENIEENISILANYYETKGKQICSQNADDENTCYWNAKTILSFLTGPDRRAKKFGMILTKLQNAEDNYIYYPNDSTIKKYITDYFTKNNNGTIPNQKQIEEAELLFVKNKIEVINNSIYWNPFLNNTRQKIQNEYKVSPYIGALTAKLYKFCKKQMRLNLNEDANKMSAELLMKWFGPRDANFQIPDKNEYLQILGIYFVHLNRYRDGIEFLIDEIFKGMDTSSNKKNFFHHMDFIVSALDILTGNYCGFKWIIYNKNILTKDSSEILLDASGNIKSRPYFSASISIGVNAKNEGVEAQYYTFLTSLTLDYYISIYDQLMTILITKEINSYTRSGNEMSGDIINASFDNIFKNMITDMHILEFNIKYKCHLFASISLNLDTKYKPSSEANGYKSIFYDIFNINTLEQITFIPELRNNIFFNTASDNITTIYAKSFAKYLDGFSVVGYSDILEPGILDFQDTRNENKLKIINFVHSYLNDFRKAVVHLFEDINDTKDIKQVIKDNESVFKYASFDYQDSSNSKELTKLIGFWNRVTYLFLCNEPLFIFFMCSLNIDHEKGKQKEFLTNVDLTNQMNVLNDLIAADTGVSSLTYEKVSIWESSWYFYLFNILNDNFNFYSYKTSEKIVNVTKNDCFYEACYTLNLLKFKSFVPVAILVDIKKDSENKYSAHDKLRYINGINISIINNNEKIFYYSNMETMINYYFDTSNLNENVVKETKAFILKILLEIRNYVDLKIKADKDKDKPPPPPPGLQDFGHIKNNSYGYIDKFGSFVPYGYFGNVSWTSFVTPGLKFGGPQSTFGSTNGNFLYNNSSGFYGGPQTGQAPFGSGPGFFNQGGNITSKDKIQKGGQLVGYINDFIGKIIFDIVKSRAKIESDVAPNFSIPIGIISNRALVILSTPVNLDDVKPNPASTFDSEILKTLDKKDDYIASLEPFVNSESYVPISSVNTLINYSIINYNIYENCDINTANQFLMSELLNIVYKKIYTDLESNCSVIYKANLEKNLHVSFDPLTIMQNMHYKNNSASLNRNPVFPIEITITCINNKFYNDLLTKRLKTYINNIESLKLLILNSKNEFILYYNYIIQLVNLLGNSNPVNNTAEINSQSIFYKGKYFQETQENLFFKELAIVHNYEGDMQTLKLDFYVANFQNQASKIGTIIIACSNVNTYKYNLPISQTNINILGPPVCYHEELLSQVLDQTGIDSSEKEKYKMTFNKIINNAENKFANTLWDINLQNLYITSYNPHYKYFKQFFNESYNKTTNVIEYDNFVNSINSAVNKHFEDIFEIYINKIGLDINTKLLNSWKKVIKSLMLYPITYKTYDNNEIMANSFNFYEYCPEGFCNILNANLLKSKYRIDFKGFNSFNTSLAECRRILDVKKPLELVLALSGGRNKNKTKKRRIKKNITLKIKRNVFHGGQNAEYEELFKNLSISSFNESIIVNKSAKDDLTKPLLIYDDQFKDATDVVVEMEKLPKYGTHFYYEGPAFSQVEESITSVYMKEFALVETPIEEETNILLLNDEECLYSDTIKFDSKLADVTSETMFNLFNNAPSDEIQSSIFYDADEYEDGDKENYGALEEISDASIISKEGEEIFEMNKSVESYNKSEDEKLSLVNNNLSPINVTCNLVSEINGVYHPTPDVSYLTESNISSENSDINKKVVYIRDDQKYAIILEEVEGEKEKYFYVFINESHSKVAFFKVDLLPNGKITNITDDEFPTLQYKVEGTWHLDPSISITLYPNPSGGRSKNNKTRKHVIKNKKNTRSKGKILNKITLKKRKFKKHCYTLSKK
jgi:hypothetical protein